MRNANLSSLNRSFIGFDRLLSNMNAHMNEQKCEKPVSYPPYNIESLAEDKYRITMAVAGFVEDELELESKPNQLVVKGTKAANDDSNGEKKEYLYQGIAERNFERKFQLGDYVTVVDASIEHGMLTVELVREVPDALKPRKIAINKGAPLEDKVA